MNMIQVTVALVGYGAVGLKCARSRVLRIKILSYYGYHGVRREYDVFGNCFALIGLIFCFNARRQLQCDVKIARKCTEYALINITRTQANLHNAADQRRCRVHEKGVVIDALRQRTSNSAAATAATDTARLVVRLP